jgi:hypothetical protein
MAGESDVLFGNLPWLPSSRDVMLGAKYQGLPTSRNVEDRRRQAMQPDPDMTLEQFAQRDDRGGLDPNSDPWDPQNPYSYPQSPMPGPPPQPSPYGGPISPEPASGAGDMTWWQRYAPPSRGGGAYGANPYYPSGPHPASQQPFNFPPGMAPGSPGWTTPPSPSGPHPAAAYPAGQGPQPPIFSPQGWPQPPAGPLSQNALPYFLQNAGYGQ